MFSVPCTVRAQELQEWESREVFTSSDLEISSPVLSPDGRWIAFVGQPSPDRSSLYLIPAQGGNEEDLIQLTRGAFTDKGLAWSPDSGSLFFFSDRVNGPDAGTVHLMRLPFDTEDGQAAGVARPVFMDPVDIPYRGGPVVSPDGQWVAFAVQETGPDPDTGVRVVPARGGMSRELARIRRITLGDMGWSEDSRHVLWDEWGPQEGYAGGLHGVPLEGGEARQFLTFEEMGTLSGFSGDGSRLFWGTGNGAPNGPGYRVTNLSGESLAYLPRPEGSPTFPRFSFEGFSTLGLGIERERVVIAQPLDGRPAKTMLTSSCTLEPTGPTSDGRVFVFASACPAEAGDSSRPAPPSRPSFMVDPADGSVEDLSPSLAPILEESSWMVSMHPGGRFVLLEGPEPGGERGNRDVLLSIADLQTGTKKTVNVSPPRAAGRGSTLGHSGFHTNWSAEAHVFGDRYIYHVTQDNGLDLMSLRPGEEPELFWTLPEEIVTRHESPGPGQAPLMADPVGIQGNLIAWVRTNYEGEVTAETRSTLMVSDAATGLDHEVATVSGYLYNPYWSRGGGRIALQYEPVEGNESTIAVFELDENHRAMGNPLTLDTGMNEYAILVGWAANDEGVVFFGSGIEALDDEGILLMKLDPDAVPVNLTSGEASPDFGVITADGRTLVYSATRTVGNTLIRYDARSGGENPGS